jgi:ACS family D-galactonate transporter-like MFS transporter
MNIVNEGQQRIPKRRWMIGMLFGTGVLINYFDRVNLSIAIPALRKEFSLTDPQVGHLLGAFFPLYAICQIPTALLLDRFGVKRVGRLGTFLWGIASTITALAGGFGGVYAARLLLGVAEAPAFPVSSKGTGYWFPRKERGLSTAIFDAAAKFSSVIGVPLVGFFVARWGWRSGFAMTATLSFFYFIVFYFIYRDPSDDKKVSDVERTYIREGGATPEGVAPASATGMLVYLLGQTKVWGLAIGFAAYGYSFYLFLTWLPGYFVKTMHMTIMQSAWTTTIPWFVATMSDIIVGGWLVDYLIAGGLDGTRVRKTIFVTGMVLGLFLFGATQTTDPKWAVLWISIALGGLGFAAPVGWSLPSLIAPKGSVGTVGGIMNFANNVMGWAAPIVTGYLVGATNSFVGAFFTAGVILLIGIVCFVFMLGKVEPIPEPGVAVQR